MIEGLKPLGKAYLEERGLLRRLKSGDADDRAHLIWAANLAAAAVDREFRALTQAGRLGSLSRAYLRSCRDAKDAGRKPAPWWAFALAQRKSMIRMVAREHMRQARWG